jgi:RHS repeat-associated protein
LTVYSMGQKLGAYNLSVNNGALVATCTGYYEYFGGKLIKNAGGYINQDRLGSIGKFFPYGQERPSATANGKEKFATYTRDAETGLDYAQNRYHSSGDGRFLSPDPYYGSANVGNPGSWNRYAYVGGDPVNRSDPSGHEWYCEKSDELGWQCVEDGLGQVGTCDNFWEQVGAAYWYEHEAMVGVLNAWYYDHCRGAPDQPGFEPEPEPEPQGGGGGEEDPDPSRQALRNAVLLILGIGISADCEQALNNLGGRGTAVLRWIEELRVSASAFLDVNSDPVAAANASPTTLLQAGPGVATIFYTPGWEQGHGTGYRVGSVIHEILHMDGLSDVAIAENAARNSVPLVDDSTSAFSVYLGENCY